MQHRSPCRDEGHEQTRVHRDQKPFEFEPITGYLNRQCPRWFGWGKCWTKHKVIFDGEKLCSFSLPSLRQVDELPVTGIDRVEALLLVASRARVVPPHARAEAPPGEATAAGLSIYDVGGKEILFCTANEAERNRWRQGLCSTMLKVDNVPSSASTSKAKPLVTQGEIKSDGNEEVTSSKGKAKGKGKQDGSHEEPKGKGKGKGVKGKGKPPPKPPPPKPPRAMIQNAKLDLSLGKNGKLNIVYQERKTVQNEPGKPKEKPLIPDLVEKPRKSKDYTNTIFEPPTDRPIDVNLSPFVSPPAGENVINDNKRKTWNRTRDEAKVLPDKAAQELGVVTAKLKMKVVTAGAAALDFAYEGFCENLDGIEILCQALVRQTTSDSDPLTLIRKHVQNGVDITRYRKIEQLLFPLSKVPRAVQRLRLLHLAAALDDRLNQARQRLDILEAAAQHLESSGHNGLLRDIVGIVQKSMDQNIGQPSISSGRRASRAIFHVGEQLIKLKTIKPPGSSRSQYRQGFNFVHWLVEKLLDLGHNLSYGAFAMEVPRLQVAAKTNPSLIYEDLKWLQAGSRTATVELRDHAASYEMSTTDDDALSPGKLLSSGRVAAVTAELLSAREKAIIANDKLQLEPPPREIGPECFLLSTGGDEAFHALRHEIGLSAIAEGSTAETFELEETSCARPTMMPDSAPLHCAAPRKWDLREMVAKDRIRKVRLQKAGTFARAARASTVSGLEGLRLSRVERHSRFREVGGQGFLWLLVPHKTRKHSWLKCYADVRAHHIIIRQVCDGRLGREAAVPLCGAEIFRLDFLLASTTSRHLASLGMLGLELRPAELFSPVIICFDSTATLERWEKCLMKESRVVGVGLLMMRAGERHAKRDPRYMCVVDPDAAELLCYTKSLDLALGSDPKLRINLENVEVHPLDLADETSAVVVGVAQQSQASCSLGFRLLERVCEEGAPEPKLNPIASFVVIAPGDPTQWHGILQTLCVASDLQNTYTAFGVGRESLMPNMTLEEDPFSKFESLRPSCAPGQRAPVGITCLIPAEVEEGQATQCAKTGDACDSPIRESPLAGVSEEPTSSASDSEGSLSDEVVERSRLDEEMSDDEDAVLGSSPLANLRRLSRKFRSEAKLLDEELRAQECSAATTLAFFDELASPGCALASLQMFLSQLAEFGNDFDAALKRVKDERRDQEKPRPKIKARVKLNVVEPALATVQSSSESSEVNQNTAIRSGDASATVVEQPTYSVNLADVKRGRLGTDGYSAKSL